MKPLLLFLFVLLIPISVCHAQESHTCPFPHTKHSPKDICGFLEVPQNRTLAKSSPIRIAYLVIKSTSEHPKPDPVIFLQGGPGGIVLPLAEGFSQLSIDPSRDFILFDPRGTGFSDPICENLNESLLQVMALDLSADQEFEELEKHLIPCEQQTNIRNYNTRENVADIEALRKHLGYPQWNLYGGSYGTRLALAYMHSFPRSVRSATLIGIFPPQAHMYEKLLANFDLSLQQVFRSCETDPHCSQKYPRLQQRFFATLNGLRKNPLAYTWKGKPFVLNTQDFLLFIHQMLYARSSIAEIPTFIMDVKNRNTARLASATNSLNQRLQYINMAVFWSTMVGDESGFSNTETLQTDLQKYPEYEPGISIFLSDPFVLDKWKKESEFIPLPTTHTGIPTLLINGGFDPITPPANAQLAAKTLSNSHVFIFEKYGHTPFNSCFFSIAKDFLNNPYETPKGDCAKRNVRFRWK